MRRALSCLLLLAIALGCRAAPEPRLNAAGGACSAGEAVLQRLADPALTSLGPEVWCEVDPCASVFATARLVDRANPEPLLDAWSPGEPATAATAPTLTRAARAFNHLCGPREAIELTASLLRFPTVSERESPATGPAFAAMRRYLEGWSRARGFQFEATPKNGAWIVSTGTGAPNLAFVMHADVVPVDEEGASPRGALPPGWTYPPYELTRVDDRLYGRGSEDDKGPIAAVLVSLHTLKRFGLIGDTSTLVQAIMGTAEESDWDGMRDFIASRPQATHVISLDASYPVVIAESGFVAWELEVGRGDRAQQSPECVEPKAVTSGQFLTQVPGEGRLVVSESSDAAERLRQAAAAARASLGDDRLRFEVHAVEDGVALRTFGVAVHSSEADAGANAMWLLARAGAQAGLCPGPIRDAMTLISTHLAGDHWGERLGLAYEHDVMGRLLVAPTVLRAEADRVILRVNMRRPAGLTSAAFSRRLDAASARLRGEFPNLQEPAGRRHVGEPALVDPQAPLVTTLMEIYREAAGDTSAQPKSIRGGTYARLFPAAVSFGPSLPGRTYRGHGPDEYLELEALELMLRTSIEAALRLK